MENLFDVFNLDPEAFISKKPEKAIDESIYKPYPELGKDNVYKAVVRFLPNIFNPEKSKIHKYYIWLKDPVSGENLTVDCPSTVGKKSILKDLYWKLKNSHSAKDQDLAKMYSRKEDYYSLVQVIKDPNRPELEGKILILKFGRKVNDMIEQQLKPDYGTPCNPYDLFEGRNFVLNVRKVGDWNNYDLCQFAGEKCPIVIEGKAMQKNQDDMRIIQGYLNGGPKNLADFDYKEWTEEINERVMAIIRNTVADGRLIGEVLGSSGTTKSAPKTEPLVTSQPTTDYFAEQSKPASEPTSAQKPANNYDDLDLFAGL
jgi:hypothetical protein